MPPKATGTIDIVSDVRPAKDMTSDLASCGGKEPSTSHQGHTSDVMESAATNATIIGEAFSNRLLSGT